MAGIKKDSWGKGPLITRVRLNPEQAVLTCGCHDGYLNKGIGVDNAYVVCLSAVNRNTDHRSICLANTRVASS